MRTTSFVIHFLLIFVFVLVLTYFTTKWIAGNQTSRSNNKNLHLIESINVGNSKKSINWVDELEGKWIDSKSADDMINDIRSARTKNSEVIL